MSAPAGSATTDETNTPSASTFLSTLIPVLIIAGVILSLFLLLRPRYKRVYHPRTYHPLLDENERTPKAADSKFGWISSFRSLDDDYALNHSTLDNYLFLRLFKVMCGICFIGACMLWPILFPVNATGGGVGTQFDVVSFTNVLAPKKVNYFYAHAIMAWIFMAFVMIVITREMVLFINLRQSIITSTAYGSRLSSRTVIFTKVEEKYRSEAALRELFRGVARVWVQPNVKELQKVVDERDKAVTKLEAAENKMCQTLVKNRKKAEKKGKNDDIPLVDHERQQVQVDPKIRPTHKLGKIPLIGKKVDTIEWARPEIQSLNQKIDGSIDKLGQSDSIGAVFVEFETLEFAQAAYRQIAGSKMGKVKGNPVTPRAVGVHPRDVIWKNLGNSNIMNKIFLIATTTFVVLLVIFWAIPVAFVGAISNIKALSEISWLTWLNSIPTVILGVISGLLPSVLLAVLMALVPIIMRLLAGMFEVTHSAVELRTQAWYFAFQVVDVFLVTTFASGAAATAQQIFNDPGGAPTLLATNLPKASNFYTAYFVVQMVGVASKTILNIGPLVMIVFLGKILDKTPRKVYNRYAKLVGMGWGSVYPVFTGLGVIALAYSIIAPLLLGFAAVGFGLLYLGFRYQVFYVYGSESIDMKGRSYARALSQLTVGVYLSEVCLVGLFAIATASSPAGTGPLVITILLLAFTIIYHVILSRTLGPIIEGTQMIPGYETRDSRGLTHDTEAAKERPSSDASPTLNGDAAPAKSGGIQAKLQHFFFNSRFAQKWLTINKPLSPHFDEPIRGYSQEERDLAFMPPAVKNEQQLIWIARDEYGLSSQEVEGCKEFNIPASDAEATLNEKAKVMWDHERIREAPIYEADVPY